MKNLGSTGVRMRICMGRTCVRMRVRKTIAVNHILSLDDESDRLASSLGISSGLVLVSLFLELAKACSANQ